MPVKLPTNTPKPWSFSLSEPRFVTAKEVISFNKTAVRNTSETYALLSEAKLQNAIAKPINLYKYKGTTDVCALCASLIFGISKAHAFEQGNKRTAFYAGLFFIEANGFGYHGSTDGTKLAENIIKLCENAASQDDLEAFLKTEFVYLMNNRAIVRNK